MQAIKLHRRSPRVFCPAYAKINLYLDVLSCRDDGFHELFTVMHALDLHDDITVGLFPSDEPLVSLRVFGARLPLDGRNLVYRAAAAYLEKTGLIAEASVMIRKKLPVAAGLAGGSSDAAATLRAINCAAGDLLNEDALWELAATIGSDVPFCLFGGTRICRGRGEVMTPLSPARPLYAVVAPGREHVSTPRAFSAMDAHYNRFDGSVPHGGDPEGLITALENGEDIGNPAWIYNAFEPVILPTCPKASSLREALLREGAYAVLMSGSGPAVFGLFSDMEKARAAAAAIGDGARATASAPLPHAVIKETGKGGSAEK